MYTSVRSVSLSLFSSLSPSLPLPLYSPLSVSLPLSPPPSLSPSPLCIYIYTLSLSPPLSLALSLLSMFFCYSDPPPALSKCFDKEYNNKTHICCLDEVYERQTLTRTEACCDYRHYDTTIEQCCYLRVIMKEEPCYDLLKPFRPKHFRHSTTTVPPVTQQ